MPEEKPRKLWMRNGKLLVNSDGQPLLSDHCCCEDSSASVYCYQKWVAECSESSGGATFWAGAEMAEYKCGEQDEAIEQEAGAWLRDADGVAHQWVSYSHNGKKAKSFCSDCAVAGDVPELPQFPCSCEQLWAAGSMAEQVVELPYVNVYTVPLIVESWRLATEEDDPASTARGAGKYNSDNSYVRVMSSRVAYWQLEPFSTIDPNWGRTVVKFPGGTPAVSSFKYYLANYGVGPYASAAGAGHPTQASRAAYSSSYDQRARGSSGFLYVSSTATRPEMAFINIGGSCYAPFTAPVYPLELNDREYFPGIIMPDDPAPQHGIIIDSMVHALWGHGSTLIKAAEVDVETAVIEACDENGPGRHFFIFDTAYAINKKTLQYYKSLPGRWWTEFGRDQWGTVAISKISPAAGTVRINWVREARGGNTPKHKVHTSDVTSDMNGSSLAGNPLWHWRSYLYTNSDLGIVNSAQMNAVLYGVQPTASARWNMSYVGLKCPEYRFLCIEQAWRQCEPDTPMQIPPTALSGDTATARTPSPCSFVEAAQVVATSPERAPMPWFAYMPDRVEDYTSWLHHDEEYGGEDALAAVRPATQADGYAFRLQRLGLDNYPGWITSNKCSNSLSLNAPCMPSALFVSPFQYCNITEYKAASSCVYPKTYRAGVADSETAASRYVETYRFIDAVPPLMTSSVEDRNKSNRICWSKTVTGSRTSLADIYTNMQGCPLWNVGMYRTWRTSGTQKTLVESVWVNEGDASSLVRYSCSSNTINWWADSYAAHNFSYAYGGVPFKSVGLSWDGKMINPASLSANASSLSVLGPVIWPDWTSGEREEWSIGDTAYTLSRLNERLVFSQYPDDSCGFSGFTMAELGFGSDYLKETSGSVHSSGCGVKSHVSTQGGVTDFTYMHDGLCFTGINIPQAWGNALYNGSWYLADGGTFSNMMPVAYAKNANSVLLEFGVGEHGGYLYLFKTHNSINGVVDVELEFSALAVYRAFAGNEWPKPVTGRWWAASYRQGDPDNPDARSGTFTCSYFCDNLRLPT